MNLFKQKWTWLAFGAVLVVLVVFGAAMMGSVLGANPKEVPVAIVVLDRPAGLPGGGELAAGEKIRTQLVGNGKLPFSWTEVGTVEEARRGMDDRRYAGALILPEDLSSGIASLTGPSPRPATVRLLVNEGAGSQNATAVKQGLRLSMQQVAQGLSRTLAEQLEQSGAQLSGSTVLSLLTPVQTQEESVHVPGANNASGNAPGLLVQIMWIAGLIPSVFLLLAGRGAVQSTTGARRLPLKLAQACTGLVLTGAASGFLVWMAASWYGMELERTGAAWLFLWLAGAAFFMLQSALLHWLGMPAMGLLVLLMFFSMPLLNMSPEFMPDASRVWIASWTPLQFAADGLRSVLYFGGLDQAGTDMTILTGIGAVCALALLASVWKRSPAVQRQASAADAV